MQTVGIFKGDVVNGLLIVTIALDIFVLISPYWVKIENGRNDRQYNVGLWEICIPEGGECFSWSEFHNMTLANTFSNYWPEMTNYLAALFFMVVLIGKCTMIMLPYLPRMVKSYTFFVLATFLFFFNLLNIAGLLCFYYGFKYFTWSLNCVGLRANYVYNIACGINVYLASVSIVLTMIYSLVMNVLYAQVRWTAIPVEDSLLYKLKIHTKPTIRRFSFDFLEIISHNFFKA